MKLLYVIDSLAPGGAETSLAELAPPLTQLGLELHILPLKRRLDLATRMRDGGAVIHAVDELETRAARIRLVTKVAGRIRPDLVHTTLFEADIAGRMGARIAGIPASSSIVGDSYGPDHYAQYGRARVNYARLLDMASARSVALFHANSEAIARTVPRRICVPRRRVEVIPRGRDPAIYYPRSAQQRRSVREALGLRADESVVLAVGRQDPVKGLDQLLNAIPHVAARFPRVTLLLAGHPGAATTHLYELARSRRISVRFLGHRGDIPDLLAAADVFCLPSLREGFPGAVLEAIAVGCPVAVSDIPANRELLGPQYPAEAFFPVGDIGSLATAIGLQLRDSDVASRAVNEGKRRFHEGFTISSTARRMMAFFERAAEKSAAAS